jgi:hypothetical protein
VRRLAPLLAAAVVALAGCGGGSKHAATTPTAATPSPARVLGAGARTLYLGGDWAVVPRGRAAVAAHLVGGVWRIDRSRRVRITILGPAPGTTVPRLPQVAAELHAPARFVETGLWVDGRELLEKGGGLSPRNVTVYGAPDRPLARGAHVAVAYGRTHTTGTAVAWTFRAR